MQKKKKNLVTSFFPVERLGMRKSDGLKIKHLKCLGFFGLLESIHNQEMMRTHYISSTGQKGPLDHSNSIPLNNEQGFIRVKI